MNMEPKKMPGSLPWKLEKGEESYSFHDKLDGSVNLATDYWATCPSR
jgi:hypothetical protein